MLFLHHDYEDEAHVLSLLPSAKTRKQKIKFTEKRPETGSEYKPIFEVTDKIDCTAS